MTCPHSLSREPAKRDPRGCSMCAGIAVERVSVVTSDPAALIAAMAAAVAPSLRADYRAPAYRERDQERKARAR